MTITHRAARIALEMEDMEVLLRYVEQQTELSQSLLPILDRAINRANSPFLKVKKRCIQCGLPQ